MLRRLLVLAVVLAACGGSAADSPTHGGEEVVDLPSVSVSEFQEHLADLERPSVVNVWASWCLPCRSEAPLLNEAFNKYGDQVEFIGVDVQDNQADARAFLDEFGLAFDHFFDRERAIANHYGGIGTPITFFFGPDGSLVKTHNGVVDDRTLALNIDELLLLDT